MEKMRCCEVLLLSNLASINCHPEHHGFGTYDSLNQMLPSAAVHLRRAKTIRGAIRWQTPGAARILVSSVNVNVGKELPVDLPQGTPRRQTERAAVTG